MQGAPSRFALTTPIPLGVASGARSDGIGSPPSKVRGKPIPSRRDADAGCGAECGEGAERYAELPGVEMT
jgi:hypothetical protein